jgi:hypothetical protein
MVTTAMAGLHAERSCSTPRVETNVNDEAKRRTQFQAQQRSKPKGNSGHSWMGIQMPAKIWNGTQHKAWGWWSKQRKAQPDTDAGPIAEAIENRRCGITQQELIAEADREREQHDRRNA